MRLAIAAGVAALALSGALTTTRTYVTFYGWPDNDPPNSSAIAYPRSGGYPTVHNHAGGVGTYDNPVTLASAPGELRVGTRVYIPYLRKYTVMEDWCSECVRDWRTKRAYRMDVWVGGRGYPRSVVLAREDALTRHAYVRINPPRGLPVDTTPLLP